MEWISVMSAAQRLGVSVKEVNRLIESDELKSKTEHGKTMVTKESVYAYSGLSDTGNQGKRRGGRPPSTVTISEAAIMLGIDEDSVKGLVKSGILEQTGAEEGIHMVTNRSITKRKNTVDARRIPLNTDISMTFEAAAAYHDTDIVKIQLLVDKGVLAYGNGIGTVLIPPHLSLEELERRLDYEVQSGGGEEKEDVKTETESKEVPSDVESYLKEILGPFGLDMERYPEMRKDLMEQHECDEHKFSEDEVKKAAAFSYKMGKLAVYESMSEFKRKERA